MVGEAWRSLANGAARRDTGSRRRRQFPGAPSNDCYPTLPVACAATARVDPRKLAPSIGDSRVQFSLARQWLSRATNAYRLPTSDRGDLAF